MMFAYYMNFGEEKGVKRSRKVIYKSVFINNRIFFFCTMTFFLCFPPIETQVLCDPVFLQLQYPSVFKAVKSRGKSTRLAGYKMKFIMSSKMVRT